MNLILLPLPLSFQEKISLAGHLPLTTGKKKHFQITSFLVLCSFFAAHFLFWFLPQVFKTLNDQTTDRLFELRSSIKRFSPAYDNRVVLVDISDTSIKKLENPYIDRSHFAKAIKNLSSMQTAIQVYDFIFMAPQDEEMDQTLINATANAGNAYFGLLFKLLKEGESTAKPSIRSEERIYLNNTKWRVNVEGDPSGFHIGWNPLITFPELANASRGLGSISVKFDHDGILRRVPLLLRYNDGFYPLLPFRVICNYLSVPPEKIYVKPGKNIILKDAKRPGDETSYDIKIPIDQQSNMIVNFIGPWERMDHYDFADVLLASNDQEKLSRFREELKGKIVVVSESTTGNADIGPVPTDANYPLGGTIANIIHNILTRSFLTVLDNWQMLIIELLLLITVISLSLRFSSVYFSLSTLSVALFYIVFARTSGLRALP